MLTADKCNESRGLMIMILLIMQYAGANEVE